MIVSIIVDNLLITYYEEHLKIAGY